MASTNNINNMDEIAAPELKLPGFRFHPTEDELLDYYLKNMILGKMRSNVITYLNIYHHDPWELPGKAKIFGEREWYFFVPRDRKHGSGGRPNRTTERGFWKATGSDRKIYSLSEPKRVIGLRKTLVFYQGRAPRGSKTDWVMNEYRLPDNCKLPKEIVLCKVYRKATSLKVMEQRMVMEAEMRNFQSNASPPSTMDTTFSFCGPQEDLAQLQAQQMAQEQVALLKEEDREVEAQRLSPCGYKEMLPEIQLPSKLGMDWNTQDWMQLNSPWHQSFIAYNNILNF